MKKALTKEDLEQDDILKALIFAEIKAAINLWSHSGRESISTIHAEVRGRFCLGTLDNFRILAEACGFAVEAGRNYRNQATTFVCLPPEQQQILVKPQPQSFLVDGWSV
jgi:hypothetical protein